MAFPLKGMKPAVAKPGKMAAAIKTDAKLDKMLGDKPEPATRAPKGHEHLGQSKHFGGK